jgi:hypothetical protein
VLPALEPGRQAGRNARPPAGVSNGGLLLERGVFGPLPDVPGALQTTHFRNNNRGQVVGVYADLSEGTPCPRGFLMDRKGKVTRIDVPGATITLPLGSTTAARWSAAGWGRTRPSTRSPARRARCTASSGR